MTVTEALRKRRSIKAYDPHFEIPAEEIRELIEVALETPSSFNLQHWRLALVTDPARKQALCEASWGQRHVAEASLVVVIAGNPQAHEEAERYWVNSPPEVQRKMAAMIRSFYADPLLQRDESIRSSALLGMSIMLAATERGWATCPMIGFAPDKVKNILKIPENWFPALMITIGKGLKEARPKSGQLTFEEVVFFHDLKKI